MYIFLLITLELVVLYMVFWYLYIRQPKHREKIVGNPWGMYENAQQEFKQFEQMTFGGVHDDSLDWLTGDNSFARNEGLSQEFYSKLPNPYKPLKSYEQFEYMLPDETELIFDHKANTYKLRRQATTAKSLLTKLAVMLDQKLSELNVKP